MAFVSLAARERLAATTYRYLLVFARHPACGKRWLRSFLFLMKSALEGNAFKPDGSVNPDSVALEKVWHELYHAYERHTSSSGGVDPLGSGTVRDSDKNPDDPTQTHPQAHERRAVRFENIIRARNHGIRIKDTYGGGYYTDKFGRKHEIPSIPVPDANPLF